ncbi:MAG: hypothetical protein IJC88_01105 [Oscillospiraceae bacterium]|nr:hypothetical protein [Oscillospiraceae bacterium]
MKRIVALFLCLCLLVSIPAGMRAGAVNAVRSNSYVYIDGSSRPFTAYNINGNNYFKLRDIAYVLNGTLKQFDVRWNSATNSIELLGGRQYTPVGGECSTFYSYKRPVAKPTNSSVSLNGRKLALTAYNIDGNNYFKLRDLGKALNFSVEWNEANQSISVESAYGYSEPGNNTYQITRGAKVGDTSKRYIQNWAGVSEVQQFLYLNEGMAYAFESQNTLYIVTPKKRLTTPMKYPLLGDVISDSAGNFYVVWGDVNNSGNVSAQTIFISKYTSSGAHVKTTGFVGESKMGATGNTRVPFDAGTCSSALHGNVLMVNYGREMYNGHQSNNVIGVKTDSMEPVSFRTPWDIPYCSHSFNQRVIWSNHANAFLYANHGDAYDRGFVTTNGSSEKTLFHFYLPSNANYDMWIVNKTFAQLGGLLETSKGAVLVGASAKSLSGNAKTEKQNLFVQIFNPNASSISKSMFVGGQERSGATSFDINDNQNSPLTPVTDYGVRWITNYTGSEVIAPHSVAANDKIVILWNEMRSGSPVAMYTVLANDGTILKAPTPLGKFRHLNSYEDPIYFNGSVYWASASGGVIRVDSIKIN